MRLPRIGVALFSVIAIASTGCLSRWVDFRVQRITAVQVHSMDEQGFDMTVHARVENPNRMGARVTNIQFQADMGGHVLGRGRVPGAVHAPARSAFDIRAKVRVRYADLPPDLPSRVAGGFLPMTVHTRLTATTALGSFDMRLRADSRTEIAQALEVMIAGGLRAPAVRVTGVRRIGLGWARLRVGVRVVLDNAFPFAVQVQRGRVALYLGGRRVGESRWQQPIVLPRSATIERDMDIVVTGGDMWRTAQAIVDGNLAMSARGVLWIEPIGGVSRIPFHVTVETPDVISL